ncbi:MULTISPECIES: pyruvate kinase [unclassified Fibrobacter]|uniref:pyruvate kinase n=1 Tax=unclassified Fibrobacter TaxID=2634177 RepID=UPI0009171DD9|nr:MULTISPECIES: pyruvate kinase [unclassified Fibrobacter]OWV07742.1 pyruvate kinase [Fibrobacter sp. UWH3]SHK52610.1 pyruvate kinase [Fibrobacter sp. UWH6]
MFTHKTKIVCSMGPTTKDDEVVSRLIIAGMNVARFNFSHGSHESHKDAMDRVKRVSANLKRPIALMLDTKGPEIRTGNTEGDAVIQFNKGDKVWVTVDDTLTKGATENEPAKLSLSWKELPQKIEPGHRILIADGLLELDVEETDGFTVKCVAKNSAAIGSKKNVNLIGLHAGLPIMSEQDKNDIKFGTEQDVDFIAASFVSYASEVQEIRRYLDSLNSKAKIIAKIENEEGLNNIREIAATADGIMIARGDLGVQLPTEKIPLAQKHIIRVCRQLGKPVITATQMLDSMIQHPRPTRAELTDVANAIFDGTDAVMLSGETANGLYPIEAVETLVRVAVTVEYSPEYYKKMRESFEMDLQGDMSRIVSQNAYQTAREVNAAALITPTLTGNTARMISMFRPSQPILAVTPFAQVKRQLLLNWGVFPLFAEEVNDSDSMVQNAIKSAYDAGAVHISDRIVMASGYPISAQIVNTIRVLHVGNELVKGEQGGCASADIARANGRILRAKTPTEAYMLLRRDSNEILLCNTLTEEYIPVLRDVRGVIVDGESRIPAETLPLINPRLVWLAQAKGAFNALESGMAVTIDGKRLVVYEGTL